MSLFQVIIYGIVQGLAEFLPISSSAHLEVLPRIMNWPDPGLEFDIALHVGTLLAVLGYFWKDWVQIIGNAFGIKTGINSPDRVELSRNPHLLWLLILGTIPGGVFGYLAKEKAEGEWRNLLLIGSTMIIFGAIMWIAERAGRQKRDLSGINWIDSLLIGCSQALAAIPGVSRSGITLTSGLFRNLHRDTAARFSFLLSTPLIAGAAVLPLLKFRKTGGLPHDMQVPFALGIVVSAIVGALVIGFFMRYVRKSSLVPFAIYRILFGIVVIAVALFRHSAG